MNLSRVYRSLLRLYPNDYQARFAAEMLHSFEHAVEERRGQDRWIAICFIRSEFCDAIAGAAAEWVSKWTTDPSVRGRCLPDVRMMRPPGVPRELWFAGAVGNCPAGEVAQVESRIVLLINQMEFAIANHDFSGARRYAYEEAAAQRELALLRDRCRPEGLPFDSRR
jgi:hypothetical protein